MVKINHFWKKEFKIRGVEYIIAKYPSNVQSIKSLFIEDANGNRHSLGLKMNKTSRVSVYHDNYRFAFIYVTEALFRNNDIKVSVNEGKYKKGWEGVNILVIVDTMIMAFRYITFPNQALIENYVGYNANLAEGLHYLRCNFKINIKRRGVKVTQVITILELNLVTLFLRRGNSDITLMDITDNYSREYLSLLENLGNKKRSDIKRYGNNTDIKLIREKYRVWYEPKNYKILRSSKKAS